MDKYCFGVDLGGTTVKIGLFSIEGQLQDKWEIPTRTENHGAEILSDIAASIQSRMDTGHLSKEQVTGIGIGVQGCVNLGWGNVRVADELSALTGLKVKAANDANVAALGEQWQGGGKGFQNLVMFTLGTGVGGGIIQNGRIISGANGAAGEIGHMVICEGGELCSCGRHGCLEAYTSARALIRMTKWKMELDLTTKMWEVAGGKLENVDGKTAFAAARLGDTRAQEVVDEYVEHLAVGLANLANVLRPQAILLGGGISNEGEHLFAPLRKAVEKKLYASAEFVPLVITKASLGNDAGVYGAFALAKGI